MKCQEVMDLEQEEAWVEVVPAEVKVVLAGAREAVLRQARAVIASVPTVVREQPINRGPPVTSSNALNSGRLWSGNRTFFPVKALKKMLER